MMNNNEPFPRFKLEKTKYHNPSKWMWLYSTSNHVKYFIILYIIGFVVYHLLADK